MPSSTNLKYIDQRILILMDFNFNGFLILTDFDFNGFWILTYFLSDADDGLKIALGERFGFRVNAPGKAVIQVFKYLH